jgi:hypothetical protein
VRIVKRSPQAATQLAVVAQIDELCAPTMDGLNPSKIDGLRSVLQAKPSFEIAELVEEVGQTIEGELDAAMDVTATQHHVPDVAESPQTGALCKAELSLSPLARDLGIGVSAGDSESGTPQAWGLPLRV